MYGCESWIIKKADHQGIYAFELWCWRRLESFLDRKEIKPVNPEGNELWVVIGRTDADAEAAILWPPDGKIWLIGKDPNAGKDWGKDKGATKDEMVGWHHWLNGHEFTQKLHEIMKDGEAWCAAVHGVTKSWTRLSDWSTTEYLRLGCHWWCRLWDKSAIENEERRKELCQTVLQF